MTPLELYMHSVLAEPGFADRRSADMPTLPLSPNRSQPGAVDERIWRALQRASQTIALGDGRLRFDDIPARHEAAALQLLCGAIQAAARGNNVAVRELPDGALAGMLLRSLRRAFLEELSHIGDSLRPGEMVHALRAVDTVEEALDRRTPPAYRISEADGRCLVVEVAHDMRSPLAAILFLVETMTHERGGPLSAAHHRQLGLVYSAAFGLNALTNDLIEFARGGGTLDGPAVPFSIAGVLAGVRDIVLPIAEEKGLAVAIRPPDTDWRVGHPTALHRVLLNLTTNALKFTDHGSVEVTARQLSRTAVEFAVTDTGRGLPANILDAIRTPPSEIGELGSRVFCSAGLGLSICRKLIEGMGGELHAETTPGEGTRFHFTIELAPSPRA